MTAAVIRHLQHSSDRPEKPDPARQPTTNFIARCSHRVREPQCRHPENAQRDRDEPAMDVEDFAKEQWHPVQVRFPFEKADKEEIDQRNRELCGGGNA